MKIAFLLREFPVLSETFILNQITGLLDQGHDVEIYADGPRGEGKVHAAVEQYDLLEKTYYWGTPSGRAQKLGQAAGLIARHFPTHPAMMLNSLNIFTYGRRARSLKLLYQVAGLLPQRAYDIIHCHFGFNGNVALDLRKLGVLKGKIATTFHGIDITKYVRTHGKLYYQDLFRQGDLFLAISEKWRERLIELGCPEEKVFLHRLGVDLNKFEVTFPQADQDFVLVSIARLVEKKGIEYGIRAVADLGHQYPKIRYYIIGDGPLRSDLEGLIQALGVRSQVIILGWQDYDSTLAYLRQCHGVLAPSVTSAEGDQEGIPITLMEAMAMGKPVISTWHSGIPELVKDGVTGLLVPERDFTMLSVRIQYLLEHPETRQAMGHQGRRVIEKDYNLKLSNQRLESLFQYTVNGHRQQEFAGARV